MFDSFKNRLQDQKDAYRRVEKDANVGPGEGVYTFRGAGRGGAPQ